MTRLLRAMARIRAVSFVVLLAGVLFQAGDGAAASPPTLDVWYAPDDEPLKRLVELYQQASRYIFVAVYGVTSPLAVKALAEAKHRGVDVRIITDRERLDDEKQQTALMALRLAGIPIKINQHDGLMHLKQVVIDDEVNTNGSMNHTTAGSRYNDERMDIIRDRAITRKARDKFLSMWSDTQRFADWK